MTWAHAWSGARRIPLTQRQTRPFHFPDIERARRKALAAQRRRLELKRAEEASVLTISEALQIARERYQATADFRAEAEYRTAADRADRFLISRMAQALASGQVA